jgi:outer membrane immunogenic protein
LSFNANGGMVGGTIGFNYQWSSLLIGAEADVDWAGTKFSQTGGISSALIGGTNANFRYQNNVLSTFGARFGFIANHALFYGKAGGAWTQEQFNISGTDPALGVLSAANTFSRWGWTLGAGVEYAVTNNFTLKAEYNYIDFGSTNETLDVTGTTAGHFATTINTKSSINVVKVGANWLFSNDW